jgi:hypothetical protein
MEMSPFAYSLCEKEDKWTWRLIDEMGEIVADGIAQDRSSAESSALDAIGRSRVSDLM